MITVSQLLKKRSSTTPSRPSSVVTPSWNSNLASRQKKRS
jgi:hypothetical protein